MPSIGIVAFAFGAPSTILSNQAICIMATKASYRHGGAPAYTQLDIDIPDDIDITRIKEDPGSPPPTLRIARGAVQWAIRKEVNVFKVASADPHTWRCVRDLHYAIKEARVKIDVEICEGVGILSEATWFCSDSTQERTRSWAKWYPRELLLKFSPLRWMWLYKKVAS